MVKLNLSISRGFAVKHNGLDASHRSRRYSLTNNTKYFQWATIFHVNSLIADVGIMGNQISRLDKPNAYWRKHER